MPVSKNRQFAKIANDVATDGTLTAEAISSDVTLGGATIYATRSALPVSGNTAGDQAYVTGNNRLYIWNGSGWYNVALLNVAPTILSVADSDGGTTPFSLSTSGAVTTITITAADSDGDPITFSSTADSDFAGLATLSQDSSVFTITPLSSDSATTESGTITFTASDGINISSSGVQTFTLTFALPGDVVFTEAFMSDISSSNADRTIPGDDSETISLTASINETEFTSFPSVAAAGSIGDFPASMGNHRFFDESTNGHTKGFVVSMNPFAVSSGNGSMEFFIRYNNNYTKRQHVCADKYSLQASTAYGLTWLRDSLTDASIYVGGIGSGDEQTSTLTVGTWYHCYFAKVGTNFYFYLDGSLESSWSIGNDWSSVVDEYVFMNSGVNNNEDDGAAVSMAGIRMLKGDLIYATSGGATITGVDEPV